jgi:hypothetical protein
MPVDDSKDNGMDTSKFHHRARCNSASKVSILWLWPARSQLSARIFIFNNKPLLLHSESLAEVLVLYLEMSTCKNPVFSHSSDMAISVKPSDPFWGLERDLQLLASSKDTIGTTHSLREPSTFHCLGENEV